MISEFLSKIPIIPDSVFVADGAKIIGDVEFGEFCTVWFNAVIRGDVNSIRIGSETNIQDGTIIHGTLRKFSTTIGSRVTIGHGAIIHGCVIEDSVLIGMGAKILDGAIIESGAFVAAGALVTPGFRVPAGTLMAGIPAKPLRRVTDAEQEAIQESPARYIEYAKCHQELRSAT